MSLANLNGFERLFDRAGVPLFLGLSLLVAAAFAFVG